MDDSSEMVLKNDEIDNLLESVIAAENIIDPVKEVSSGNKKGNGYTSFWTMVAIKGKNKQIDLAIKCAPRNPSQRIIAPINMIFEKEICFYEVIYPALLDFQNQHKIVFTSLPKCYKSSIDDSKELLVLENIKAQGFKLWDCKVPMDDDHLRLVLKTYANFHAVSFAFKDQNREAFLELVKDVSELFTRDVFEIFSQGMITGADKIIKLKQDNEGLCGAMEKFKGSLYDFFAMLEGHDKNIGVILHGDCWCNNMMFQYEDTNKPNVPTKMKLLDFQVVRVGSPVTDLSTILLISGGKTAIDNFDGYLQFYYDNLSSAVALLGSDLQKLYTMESFMGDWKVYSRYGFSIACMGFHLMLREDDEMIGVGDVKPETFKELGTVKIAREDEADGRLCELAEHMYGRGFI